MRLPILITLLLTAHIRSADLVPAGAGSYLHGLPAGAKGPPPTIYKTADVQGAMPTNDWWSSLAWVPLSDSMFPHPLAMKAVEGGLRIWNPGAAIAASKAAIMGAGGEDLVLGHSAINAFTEARVAGWSDWFVTAQMGEATKGMKLTFGHGSPFVFVQYSGGEPVLNFKKAPEVTEKGETLMLRIGRSVYALFAPGGSTWSGLGTTRLTAQTHGKGYFSLALLPDDQAETLELFRLRAHTHVIDSKVSWVYDEKTANVKTTFDFSTKVFEGKEISTVFALYPHQWRETDATLTGQSCASVRGPMKLATGLRFTTTMKLPSVLPSLPLTTSVDKTKLRELVDQELAGTPQLTGDTYWLGKQLGKWATLLPLAEQAGHESAVKECDQRLRTAMEDFFTASDSKGLFAFEPAWGTLIGYPASFGSDDQLNDHHFHYGYFFRAAGELARRDPAWAAKWHAMLDLLARDVVSADREDKLFPFLRCFDPYAGHSWASGHAKFGDGNNNESSSEAVNAWFGLMLLGDATGDKTLRDLGAWLFTTEIAAIEDYWFDVRDDLHPADYTPSVVTMVWGGKGANGTWFSGNPEAVHGINFLPITGASLYLGRWPDYARKNYVALIQENPEGANFDAWAEIMWMYRALTDPTDAQTMWNARPSGFKPEAGNSLAQTYAWITAFNDLGTVDRSITADAPFTAVFTKDGKRAHVAWNLAKMLRTITFSDGIKVECPAGSFLLK